jgi:hypothetical protein
MRVIRVVLWLGAVGVASFWLEAAVHRFRGFVCLAPIRRRCPAAAPWFPGSTIRWLAPVIVFVLLGGWALLSVLDRRSESS